jgi:hypothetical protein
MKEFPSLFVWPDTSSDGQLYATRCAPLVREDQVEHITVSRISRELMEARPSFDGSSGNLTEIDNDKAYFLLDEHFNVLAEVEQDYHLWTPRVTEHRDGETVGEAIARHPNPDAVIYILRRHTGFEIEERYSVGGYEATLYKPPQGWTLKAWVDEQTSLASKKLAAQIAELDAEG